MFSLFACFFLQLIQKQQSDITKGHKELKTSVRGVLCYSLMYDVSIRYVFPKVLCNSAFILLFILKKKGKKRKKREEE